MKTEILKGVDPALEKELRGDFISAKIIRRRIREVLHEKVENNRTSLRVRNFEDAAWAYKQAYGNGYEQALFDLIGLLED